MARLKLLIKYVIVVAEVRRSGAILNEEIQLLKKLALLAVSLLLIVSVLAAAACGSSDSSTSSGSESVVVKQVVPQKANLVAGLSLFALGDTKTGNLYNQLAVEADLPATYDQLLKTVQEKIGLDLKGLKEAVVFADLDAAALSQDTTIPYMGAIVNGTFKQDEMIAAIQKTLGHSLEIETYNGYSIYIIQGSLGIASTDNLGARLSFLDQSNLVVGSDQAVKNVIDVKKGNEQGLSGELLSLYEGLGNSQAKLAMEIQKEWLTQIPDEQAIPGIGQLKLSAFKDMRMATLAIDQTGNTSVLEIKVDFYNSNSTNSAKETIDGIVNIFHGLMKMTQGQTDTSGLTAIAKLLDSLQLSISGTWMTLHLEVTTDQINELMPLLQGMSSTD
jgi:hypothetical protein